LLKLNLTFRAAETSQEIGPGTLGATSVQETQDALPERKRTECRISKANGGRDAITFKDRGR